MPDYPMGVQRDELGRPFLWRPDGSKNYISPVAFGASAPEDTTSVFHQAPQWNQRTGEWETPFDWGNVFTMGTAAALTGGAANALMAPASAAGAGAGTAAPSMVGATAPAAAAATAAGGGLPSWLGPVLSIGTGLAGRALTGNRGNNANQIPIPPELQQLLAEATRRQMNQGPLSDAITQQALAGLPTYAKRG